MPPSPVSLVLILPLAMSQPILLNAQSLKGDKFLVQEDHSTGPSQRLWDGDNRNRDDGNRGGASAIAQIFPDISHPDSQLVLQAEGLLNSGMIEDGIAFYEQGIQRLQERGEPLEAVRLLNALASNLETQGELPRAALHYQRALDLYINHKAPLGSFDNDFYDLVTRLGSVYLALGETDKALTAYEQGLAIARQPSIPWGLANLLSQVGVVYRLAGQPEQALSGYQQAVAYYQEMGDSPYDSPKVWNRIGMIYLEQGQLEPALAAYQQGLVAHTNPQESFQIATHVLTLENISHLYRIQGQNDQATAYAQQAETALTTHPDPTQISPAGDHLRQSMILEEIGKFYLEERYFDRANAYFDRALAIARQSLNVPYDETMLLNSITRHYTQLGQLEQAIPYEERNLDVVQKMGLSVNSGLALAKLAHLYQGVGQWERALATYGQAIDSYKEADLAYGGQSIDIALTFLRMGKIYAAQGQFEPALTAYQQALTRYQESLFLYGEIAVLEHLAQLYGGQGQVDRARQYAQQAQTLRE